jgi:hypothetical protein
MLNLQLELNDPFQLQKYSKLLIKKVYSIIKQ